MRINELEKEIDSLERIHDIGLRVRQTKDYIIIDRFDTGNLYQIAYVRLDEEFIIDTNNSIFNRLPKGLKEDLFHILTEFARTSVDDREDKKKYLIVHKFFLSKNCNAVNLAWNQKKNVYRLINCSQDNHIYQVLFTKEEIEKN